LNDGYGLWKEYGAEFARQINLLTSAGYTIVFISHEDTRTFKDETGEEYVKIYPSGDKRAIDPICDLVDIIGYVKPNGMDENGVEIKSSVYLTNTKQYHAGSRFDYLVPYIEEFTAESLQAALAEAIIQQEKTEGITTVDYSQFKNQYTNEELTFEQLQEKIKEIAIKLNDDNRIAEYREIIEKYLGANGSVKDATKKQQQQLELIYNDLKELE
jgi:hypothetical protein